MLLEYDINLAVLNLPNNINIVDFFSHILKALYWRYDDIGRKPVGLDQYLIRERISNWDMNSMRIHISMRLQDSRFTDVVAIDGGVCKGKVNGLAGYSLSFTVEERARLLYGRTADGYIKLLIEYFNEHLGLNEVKICEVTSFRDID